MIQLSKSKAFGALVDGLKQVVAQLVVRLVHRQIQLIETKRKQNISYRSTYELYIIYLR